MATQARSALAQPGQISPLMDISAELRNKIYHRVLSENGEYVEITLKATKRHTAILRTCSQIWSEATQIFYATNNFIITDVLGQQAEVNRFLKNAGANTKLIPKVIAQIKLPKIFMQVLSLVFDTIGMITKDTSVLVGRAYSHVLKTLRPEFEKCGKKLVNCGIAGSRIEVERCGSDFYDYRYGDGVDSFEERVLDTHGTFFARSVGHKNFND